MDNKLLSRDSKVDILRGIAIICIILAHSQPNNFIFQLRNFDVTLMVLLLGNSFYLSTINKSVNYMDYIKKRFNRLVIQTWIFLSIFFSFFYLISILKGDHYYFTFGKIVNSYALASGQSGIGFVWIMRVFFVVALLCPLLAKITKAVKSNLSYFFLIASGYMLYLLLLYISEFLKGSIHTIFEDFIVYGLGYALIAAVGIRLSKLSNYEINLICLAFFIIFLWLMVQNNFSNTQKFKYPPGLYYLSYGLFVSLLLYRLLDFRQLRRCFENRFIYFIAHTSAWIYFWHIVFFYILYVFGKYLPWISGNSASRFLFMFMGGVALTYIQQIINDYFLKRQLT